ncbi:MAG: nickel pincer cofactor biosynthesis protein LarC [Clostridia bacterium]|nr:nickel pincer cofactor biosynthesis protein LarC [Clostridia bacterium]
MKTLYLDLGMGAAGDMLTAALIELLPDPGSFIDELNSVGIPGVSFEKERSVKCGIAGTHIKVTVNGAEEGEEHHHHHHGTDEHEHHHGSPDEISHIVSGHLSLPEKIKRDILSVYGLIAEAESHVHGVPVTDIHFHEVGTMDALADITAVCMLKDRIAPDEIVASPVHVGSGKVKCAHGILPVPAPATAYILRGIPTYGGSVDGELCTPTGAALLKHFVTRFGNMPAMSVETIGYGMGKKDFEAVNCVRAMLGKTCDKTDGIAELSFNVDDMTAEEVAFALDAIRECGAKEVFTVPVGMKKNRQGTLVCVLCDKDVKDAVIKAVFKHTTTLGIREESVKRYILERETESIETDYGVVRKKTSWGYGVVRSKYEYDDVARIAREQDVGFREALGLIDGKKE